MAKWLMEQVHKHLNNFLWESIKTLWIKVNELKVILQYHGGFSKKEDQIQKVCISPDIVYHWYMAYLK